MSGRAARCTLLVFGMAVAGCGRESPVVTPVLVTSCSATPGSGPAPLVVSFSLNVAGAQGSLNVQIQYGDGQSGVDVGQRHTYAGPGSYTATFTVTTPTQSALCSATVQVSGAVGAGPSPSPRPSPSGPNQPPLAVYRTEPDPGPGGRFVGRAPFTIHFNLCGSQDPEGDPFLFTMDFEGDGVLDVVGSTGADCRHTFTYGGGTFYPRLCVTDLNEGRQPAHPPQCRTYTVDLLRP